MRILIRKTTNQVKKAIVSELKNLMIFIHQPWEIKGQLLSMWTLRKITINMRKGRKLIWSRSSSWEDSMIAFRIIKITELGSKSSTNIVNLSIDLKMTTLKEGRNTWWEEPKSEGSLISSNKSINKIRIKRQLGIPYFTVTDKKCLKCRGPGSWNRLYIRDSCKDIFKKRKRRKGTWDRNNKWSKIYKIKGEW